MLIRDMRGREIEQGAVVEYNERRWIADTVWYQRTGSTDEPRHEARLLLLEITDRPFYREQRVLDSDSLVFPDVLVIDAGLELRRICDAAL